VSKFVLVSRAGNVNFPSEFKQQKGQHTAGDKVASVNDLLQSTTSFISLGSLRFLRIDPSCWTDKGACSGLT